MQFSITRCDTAPYFICGYFVASELKDPICHSNECQIGSFSSEATICYVLVGSKNIIFIGIILNF